MAEFQIEATEVKKAPQQIGGRFSFADVAAIADVPETTLRIWLHRNVVRASAQSAGVRGVALLFDFADVFAVWTVGNLRKQGVPLEQCRKAVELLYSSSWEGSPVLYLAADETKLVTGKRADVLRRKGKPAIMIDIDRNVRCLEESIDAERAGVA